jgi:hypothetical protein
MTVIAVKDGVMATDSRYTSETESGGIRMGTCTKLYAKRAMFNGVEQDVVIGVAGEGFPALVFVDWFGTGQPPPDNLIHGEADFTALVMAKDGVWEFDKWCRGEKSLDPFQAAGCGSKGALTAMHMGASATKAVEVTCRVDPFCGPPIHSLRLPGSKKRSPRATKPAKPAVPAAPETQSCS